MGKIKILPEELVNKIAAGEVVENPAAVVKELLDNAYDAKGNNIIVEIEEGGLKKIQIIDNGTGMTKDDAEMAFKPHATSKINDESDLLNIKHYGFRGEALSSIAAVSKVNLKTRISGENLGTQVIIEGGVLISVSEVGTAVGTSITIDDLFYNVPARREFLRTAQNEYKDILEVVNAHALANATVGLSLIHNGKNIYNMPKDQKLEDRTREILGADYAEKLTPVFFEHPHLEIYGFIGKPEIASERRKNQYLFVNKRAINHKSVSFAIKDAYGSLIPNNAYPPYVVFIDVPANIVDVNVHPRKEEVKFSNEQFIFSSVKSAVKKALDRTNLTPGSESKADPFGMNSGFGTSPFGGGSTFGSKAGKTGSGYGARGFGSKGGYGSEGFGAGTSPYGNFGTGGFGKPANNTPFKSPFAKPTLQENKPSDPFVSKDPFVDPFADQSQIKSTNVTTADSPVVSNDKTDNTSLAKDDSPARQADLVNDAAKNITSDSDITKQTDVTQTSDKDATDQKSDTGASDTTQMQQSTDPINNNTTTASPYAADPFGSNNMYGRQKPYTDPFWDDPYGDNQDPYYDNTFGNQNTLGNIKLLQVHNLYLVTESEEGIIIYDQHAVHERILYEELINSHKEKKAEGSAQGMLTPVVVNLSASENEIFNEYKAELENHGFAFEEFGNRSYKITQVPAVLAERDIKAILHELVEDLSSDEKLKETDTKSNKMLTYLACRTAYKAGDAIPPEEALALIDKLGQMENSYTCPHGRPVKIEFTLKELAKMFKRT